MKKFVLDFLRRGLIAAGIGPIVLAIVYLILQQASAIETLSVNQVCIGIFSITALAFIAGGMNAIYQIERLPLLLFGNNISIFSFATRSLQYTKLNSPLICISATVNVARSSRHRDTGS